MTHGHLNWPPTAKFGYGDRVRRGDMPGGRSPAYRFPGVVVGWYSVRQYIGYAVSRDDDPGCIQIFPEHLLEATS